MIILNYLQFILLCVMLFMTLSCATQLQEGMPRLSDTLAIIDEKDLIPEGTAYDPVHKRILLSSMYKRKIVAIEEDGSYYDFARSASDSLWGVLGMEVDSVRSKLWVISSKGEFIPTRPRIADQRWNSRLYCYDLLTSKLEGIYVVENAASMNFAFNDLTISNTGDVYVTESLNSSLYLLRHGTNKVEEFLSIPEFTFLNGIAFQPDGTALFVSCTEGVIKVDITTKQHRILPYKFTDNPSPIDGLVFYKDGLIGHQSSQLTRFILNNKLDSIIGHTVLDSVGLDGSTSGVLGANGWYYYIVNSQIRTGVDYENKIAKPLDSLENVIIRRLKLQ